MTRDDGRGHILFTKFLGFGPGKKIWDFGPSKKNKWPLLIQSLLKKLLFREKMRRGRVPQRNFFAILRKFALFET